MQLIGVDTGGTFTDTVILDGRGQAGIGKTLSSLTDPGTAVLRSVAAAAAQLGQSLHEVLAATDIFSHGTTIGLNSLLTGTGARVGLLTTMGFESTLPIAKINKVHGLDELDQMEPTRWEKPPLVVPRRAIRGVRERIDAHGEVVVPLDEEQARHEIRALGEQGVQAVAVSLLWSVYQPAHEQRLRELLAEELPGVHVSLSSELAPHIGEYERTMTTVLNAYIAPLVTRYIDELDGALRREGFRGTFLLMQSGGGVARALQMAKRPLDTVNSGPVGGMAAALQVGRSLGHPNVITTDVGGTSFDVGLVVDGSVQYLPRPMLNRHVLANPIVDILSIGTGGGSIAWVDRELGALRVGPQSAGSDPGPVCYGRGGTLPTLTDAAVTLGYVDRLGGQLTLDRDAAVEAIRTHLAEPLGTSVERAAEGVLRVANAAMADLVRRATVRRGHDPRHFALYAFGGAAAQYAGGYAADLGCQEVVIPDLAATFSAYGAAASDLRTYAERELDPVDPAAALDQIRSVLSELEVRARAELRPGEGEVTGEVTVVRRAGVRFRRQVHQLQVELPDSDAELSATAVAERFRRDYEKVIGAGTTHADTPVEVVSLSVEGRLAVGGLRSVPADGVHEGQPQPTHHRTAWFDGAMGEHPVYARADLPAGAEVAGPAFIELDTTTIVVYPGQRAVVDAGAHVRLLTS